MQELVRKCIFRPYIKGRGPAFTLQLFDCGMRDDGKYKVGYKLSCKGKTIFAGDDFGCPPYWTLDGDETVKAIMDFLTLRPGDVEKEYFADYTKDQLNFRDLHAEALYAEVLHRFGE